MIDPASLAFDIDGVVADTMSLFVDIAKEEYAFTSLRYEDITCYNLGDCIDMDTHVIEAIVEKLLDRERITRLKPIKGAPEVLARLAHNHGPILFVTARPDAGVISQWVADVLGLLPGQAEIIATGSFDSKADILKDRQIRYFVEDRLETCFPLNAAGITPVLFHQPWNRRPHPFVEVSSWNELEALINFC